MLKNLRVCSAQHDAAAFGGEFTAARGRSREANVVGLARIVEENDFRKGR
jgi:hypothetical protein